jgi:uncharacterized Fe-S cluster protein YjdI
MDKASIVKKYSNGEVTIVWKPGQCIHSAICWKHPHGLSTVFNPHERPWIKPEAGSTTDIINQVKKCPSGALSYFMNETEIENQQTNTQNTRIELIPNGPYVVTGNFCIVDANGGEKQGNETLALCRCGGSTNKPFCDGSHVKNGFNDSK